MIDPFSSNLPMFHPKRIFFKLYVLVMESIARLLFTQVEIASKYIDGVSTKHHPVRSELSVTDMQLDYLLHALDETESFPETVVVEIGAFRGETTARLAAHTQRTVIAVDKYFQGWKLAEDAHKSFINNTKNCPNVILERKTSGEAVTNWRHPKASLIFIDAQHNFVNTWFDINAWLPILEEGGLLALHDVDQKAFAGTRLAAWLAARKLPLWAHIDGLIIFRKP